MGLLEAASRIVQLGGAPERASSVAAMRKRFEERTGSFASEDGWFEERSRAFWCDAVTRERFGRLVEDELTGEERAWLGPLERAHRGLFRAEPGVLVDVWSGAELVVTAMEDASVTELESAAGQLFDARVAGCASDEPDDGSNAKPLPRSGMVVALLPGSVFHPAHATAAIGPVLDAARQQKLSTHDVLDALLRMERTLRSLSRVKAAYAYRPEMLARPVRADSAGGWAQRHGSPRVR